MPVAGAMAENATLFFVYNQTRHLIASIKGELTPAEEAPFLELAPAGAMAGAAASLILTPVELIKCRMQVQMMAALAANPNLPSTAIRLPGSLSLISSTLKQEGMQGLWLGQLGTFYRETGGGVAWFLSYEAVTRAFLRQKRKTQPGAKRTELPTWQQMLAGASAGSSYVFLLFPVDSIKSTIQTRRELLTPEEQARRSSRLPGFLETGREIWRARGLTGFYAGCGISMVRSAASSAMIFSIYSAFESRFG